MGLLLSDMLIFLLPQIILTILSALLGIKVYSRASGLILPALTLFSMPFILVNYLIGYLFSTPERAFKL
jgi:hypothetical protein